MITVSDPTVRWKALEGYSNYLVSDTGKVYSMKLQRLLNPKLQKRGVMVSVTDDNGKKRARAAHVMVAEGFLEDYFLGVKIRHKDRDRSNNHVDNLFLVDWLSKEPRDTKTERYSWAKKARIVEWDQDYASVRELADDIGGDLSSIYRCLRGEQRIHLGLTFEYID